jgi:DNA-binding NtrC family response regulator
MKAAFEELAKVFAGTSGAAIRVRDRLAALASLRVPVLLSGEPGSGRECAARALHRAGPWRHAPFTRAVCAGGVTPPPRVAGFFYLDTIESLPPDDQRAWRAWLERHLRANRVRVIASTGLELARLPQYDAALAARLARFRISLPPLRERTEDVPLLAHRILRRHAECQGRKPLHLGDAAIRRLARHGWPGNVRELSEVLERLVARARDGPVDAAEIERALHSDAPSVADLRARGARRERDELVDALDVCRGNLAAAARRLGLSRSAVVYRARKHGLLRSPDEG